MKLGSWADDLSANKKKDIVTWANLGNKGTHGSLFGIITFLVEVANQQEAQIDLLMGQVSRLEATLERAGLEEIVAYDAADVDALSL